MRKTNMFRLALIVASGATLLTWGCGWGEGWRAVAAYGVTAIAGFLIGINTTQIL